MNYHFTSDVHQYHKNIIKYSDRPFTSVEEMNYKIIENWNRVVKPEDVVWQLGDFCFAKIDKIEEFLSQLNGQKYAVLGNHDDEIIKYKDQLLEKGLFKEIVPYKELTIHNQKINLFHYGCRIWNKAHYGSWLLYGHSHGSLPPYGKSVDVGVDSEWVLKEKVYRPFNFWEIKKFMDNQPLLNHHDQ